MNQVKKEDFKYLSFKQSFKNRGFYFISNVFWIPLLAVGLIGTIIHNYIYIICIGLGFILFVFYIYQSFVMNDVYKLLSTSKMIEKKINEHLRNLRRASIISYIKVEGSLPRLFGKKINNSHQEKTIMNFNLVVSSKIVQLSMYNLNNCIIEIHPKLHVDHDTLNSLTQKRARYVVNSKKLSTSVSSSIRWSLDKNYNLLVFMNASNYFFSKSTFILATLLNFGSLYCIYFDKSVAKLEYPIEIYSSITCKPEYNTLHVLDHNESEFKNFIIKNFVHVKNDYIFEQNHRSNLFDLEDTKDEEDIKNEQQ